VTGRIWWTDAVVLYFASMVALIWTWELGMALLVIWILLTAEPRGR
jgi:hypothetical protein